MRIQIFIVVVILNSFWVSYVVPDAQVLCAVFS